MNTFSQALTLAAESGHHIHADAVIVGAGFFVGLIVLMLITMNFSNAASRHPRTPARVDPHRTVHSRESKSIS